MFFPERGSFKRLALQEFRGILDACSSGRPVWPQIRFGLEMQFRMPG
jgi:hypothetical protein